MEEIISLVVTGCKLAEELESNLNRLNGTVELLEKCEAVNAVFTAAINALRAVKDEVAEVGVGVGPMQSTISKGKEPVLALPEPLINPISDSGGFADEVARGELRLLTSCGAKTAAAGGGEGSSLQKSRKRKDESGKRTIEVAAPMHGNTDIPPDDGYTWRKYGQKEILNSHFPRGYYRCTHQRLYNCPAKKQVQRLNNNPRIFQVIYRGDHICHMSSTAPASAIPPPPIPNAHNINIPDPNVASLQTSLPNWFTVDMTSQPLMGIPNTTISMSTSMNTTMTIPIFDPNSNTYNSQVTNTNVVGGSNVVVNQGDQYNGANVVDMADAMFNASVGGGGGGDGIDFIFSNWEPSQGKH